MKFEELTTKKDLELLEVRIINSLKEKLEGVTGGFGWVRTEEASERLGLSKSQLANLRARGEITFSKIGGTIYYDLDDIDRQLRINSVRSHHTMFADG